MAPIMGSLTQVALASRCGSGRSGVLLWCSDVLSYVLPFYSLMFGERVLGAITAG